MLTPSQLICRQDFREVLCDVVVDDHDAMIDRSVGSIRHLSYHEERHDSEQLQLRPVGGNLAINDVSDVGNVVDPLWASGKTDASLFGSTLHGGDAVWSKLLEATSSRETCARSPCGKVSSQFRLWTIGPRTPTGARFEAVLRCPTPFSLKCIC